MILTQFDIWAIHVVVVFADITRDHFLWTFTLCHLINSRRAKYGLTILPFSSEVDVPANQTLIRGDYDQEADQHLHSLPAAKVSIALSEIIVSASTDTLNQKHTENLS